MLIDGYSEEFGSISGAVVSNELLEGVSEGWAGLYDDTGEFVNSASLVGGTFAFNDLAPGDYYLRTESTGFIDELNDDIPCLFGNCEVTGGLLVTVNAGGVSFVDFELEGAGGQLFFDGFEQ